VPVLAIHGLGGGAWFFSGFARRAAAHCRVIAVDLPGTGRSAGAGRVEPDAWVEQLGSIVADRTSEPAVILGHSMGTILGLKAWQAWPERIRALVFVGGLPQARPLIRERLRERAEAVRRRGLDGLGPTAAAANFSPDTLARRPEIAALFERMFELQDPETYVRCCEILLSISAAGVPPTVSVPCLAVTGADDQYAPPDLVSAFSGELRGRHEEVVLPGCGHLPFLERPREFAAAVTSFVASLC
jgi:3-oxoadipate enol-lactonase